MNKLSNVVGIGMMVISLACSEKEIQTFPEFNGNANTISGLISCSEENSEQLIECGTFAVPENRSKPNSRAINLPIRIYRTKSTTPQEPIFYLNGGPGVTNVSFHPFQKLLETRDVVLVGYRGVDGDVKLKCPTMFASDGEGNMFSKEQMEKSLVKIKQCAENLTIQGIDLEGYTMLEVIDDMEEARKLLGYNKIHLLSQSYGTRLAQIYAHRYPQSLYRSLMVAANPPGHFVWLPETIDSQIEYYGDLCAKDPDCSTRTDDLAEAFDKVIHNMPTNWLGIPIDSDKVRMGIFMSMYHRESAVSAIDAIIEASNGDASGLAALSVSFDLLLGSMDFNWGDSFAKAYSDYDPSVDYAVAMNESNSILGSPGSQTFGLQKGWPGVHLPEEYNKPQISQIETLILSGTVDFSTPARFATHELLPYLPNGHQVILKEMGHSGDLIWRDREAFAFMADTFYESGRVDDSKFIEEPMSFEVEMSMPFIAKVTVSVVVGVILLLAGLTYLIVRWVRRKRKINSHAGIQTNSAIAAV